MIVSMHEFPEHKVVYVEVPKACCSSIKWSLRGVRNEITPEEFEDGDFHRWFGYNFVSEDSVRSNLASQYKDWKKFTVVRNPYRRFESLFNDGGKGKPDGSSIKEFIEGFENGKWMNEQHGALQSRIIGGDVSLFDFVGRAENMIEVFDYMDSLFGCVDRTRQKKSLRGYRLDEEDMKSVYRIFEEDFNLLEYEK